MMILLVLNLVWLLVDSVFDGSSTIRQLLSQYTPTFHRFYSNEVLGLRKWWADQPITVKRPSYFRDKGPLPAEAGLQLVFCEGLRWQEHRDVAIAVPAFPLCYIADTVVGSRERGEAGNVKCSAARCRRENDGLLAPRSGDPAY